MITGREISRDEIKMIWTIDRSEVIEAVYYLEQGNLVLKQEYYDMRGWLGGETEKNTSLFEACYDRGGWFYGLFDDQQLIGVVVLERCFIGENQDQIQLKFLHVSNPYRDKGWGKHLFDLAMIEAKKWGARRLYISATPSEHTIGFYLSLGCRVTQKPDPELYELEPEDIHLEFNL
jgi:predicted N-acetyltransferase YhbS